MTWLSRFLLANWSHILNALILLMALLCGMQMGESRVQKHLDAENQKIALTQARQEQHVTETGGRDMPAVPEAPVGAASAPSNPLLAPSGEASEVSCGQLSRDAAQTTLMLMEVERWY
jgi:hypothetical protein